MHLYPWWPLNWSLKQCCPVEVKADVADQLLPHLVQDHPPGVHHHHYCALMCSLKSHKPKSFNAHWRKINNLKIETQMNSLDVSVCFALRRIAQLFPQRLRRKRSVVSARAELRHPWECAAIFSHHVAYRRLFTPLLLAAPPYFVFLPCRLSVDSIPDQLGACCHSQPST